MIGGEYFLRLKRITYENFRNHRSLTFEPSDDITLIYGENGSGKTSILEGVLYCALTRGFVGATDSECLSFLSDYFLLDSNFLGESDNAVNVKITYKKEKEKQVIVNNSEIKPFSRHIGRIPCVTFSPQELVIVNGSPSERRRFLDNAMSQTDRRYLDNLLDFRRVLQQRNALLAQWQDRNKVQQEMLSLWTEQLSRVSSSIVSARVRFLASFFNHFSKLYSQFSLDEQPAITYRSSLGKITEKTSTEDLYNRFLGRFNETRQQEIMRSQTMTGPHRDDLLFLINEKEIKKYASQGQLRTFLICLKLSLHQFFYDTLGEKPLCLLDDIFSELDESRCADIVSILQNCGQTIITSAEKKFQGKLTVISIGSLKK